MVTSRPCFPLQLFDLGVCALNKQHSRKTVSAFLFYIRITLQPQRPIGRKENIRKTLFGFYHEGSFPNVHNLICLYRVILVFIFLPLVSLYLGFALFFSDTHQHILLWPFKNWMKSIWARSAFAQEKECCRYVDNTSNNPVYNCIKIALKKDL